MTANGPTATVPLPTYTYSNIRKANDNNIGHIFIDYCYTLNDDNIGHIFID